MEFSVEPPSVNWPLVVTILTRRDSNNDDARQQQAAARSHYDKLLICKQAVTAKWLDVTYILRRAPKSWSATLALRARNMSRKLAAIMSKIASINPTPTPECSRPGFYD